MPNAVAITQAIRAASAKGEQKVTLLQGNGVGNPMGMLNAGATISVNRTGAGRILPADFATVWSMLLVRSTRLTN
jgi:hypothetical protein